MLNKLLLAAGLSIAFALPALAQQSPSSSTGDTSSASSSGSDDQSSSSQASGTASMTIRQHLKQDLVKGGFSDVQVTPTSFFVQAKNKNGHRVMMMIGPDSVTTITGVSAKTASSKSSSDSSGSSDGSSSQSH